MIALPRYFARNGWTAWHLAILIALAAIGVGITFNAWADIFRIAYHDEESTQIFLAPIIALWLLIARRDRLRFVYPRGAWIGAAMILAGWAIASYGYSHISSPWAVLMRPVFWMIYRIADAAAYVLSFGHVHLDFISHLDEANESLWHFGSLLIVIGCILSVAGRDALARFKPVFFVLLFLLPVPTPIRQAIALPLQESLAAITQNIFDVIGIEVARNGSVLSINGEPVAIAEGCNGMRMVFTLVLISYAFAFAHPLKGYVRAIIIAASPVSAMFCNIVRMIPTVMLYGHAQDQIFGMSGQIVAKQFHDWAGWVMLVAAFLILLGIIKILRWGQVPVTPYTLAYD